MNIIDSIDVYVHRCAVPRGPIECWRLLRCAHAFYGSVNDSLCSATDDATYRTALKGDPTKLIVAEAVRVTVTSRSEAQTAHVKEGRGLEP